MHKRLKTQLTALQQEGYSIPRAFSWWINHLSQIEISSKKPLVLTKKTKILLVLSYLHLVLLVLFLDPAFKVFVLLLFWFSPMLYLFSSLFLIWPYEKINRFRTVRKTYLKINSLKNMTVIGVTGSYGKTSIKDFLYTILATEKKVVKTPESYNTIFGISKVVDFELTEDTEIFICEMGAYTRGEIAEMCRMVTPKYAILSAVGTQHLERFGSLENTTLAKFELVDAVDPQNCLVNIDNNLISEHRKLDKYIRLQKYGVSKDADWNIKSYEMKNGVMKIEILHSKKVERYQVSLFGKTNLSNITAAIAMARILGLSGTQVQSGLDRITPSPHRLELKKLGKATLIDNAFSSNEAGFVSIIEDLRVIKGKKVIITPGIVELGEKTEEVHKKIGEKIAEVFDRVYLVGETTMTKSLNIGVDGKIETIKLKNDTNLWPIIRDLSKKFDWILLENDLTDIY